MSSKLDYLSKYTSSGATDGESKKEKRKQHKKEKKKKRRKTEESKKKSLYTNLVDEDDFPIKRESDDDDFDNVDDDDGPVVVTSNLDTDAVQATAPRGVWKTVNTAGDGSSRKRDEPTSTGATRRRRYDSSSSSEDERSRPRQRYDSSDDDEDRKRSRPRRHDSDQEEDAIERRDKSKPRRRYDSSSEDENNRQSSDLRRNKRRHDSADEGSIQSGSRQRRRYDSSDDEENVDRGNDRKRKRSVRHDSSSDDGEKNEHRGRKNHSNSSSSRRRRKRYDSDDSDTGRSDSRRRSRHDSDSDGESSKEGARMSSGHKAGLQNYKDFNKSERKIQAKKHRDAQHMVDKHGMGETVYRDKDGRKTTAESNGGDPMDTAAAAERLNQGKVQKAVRDAKARELLDLQNSGFARYRDDTKLETELKNEIRKDDPMAKYAISKLQQQGKRSKTTSGQHQTQAKPIYKGPPPKPNRFGIRPGYRWDGNDRGNGFEDKILAKKFSSARKAEQSYKWSSADM